MKHTTVSASQLAPGPDNPAGRLDATWHLAMAGLMADEHRSPATFELLSDALGSTSEADAYELLERSGNWQALAAAIIRAGQLAAASPAVRSGIRSLAAWVWVLRRAPRDIEGQMETARELAASAPPDVAAHLGLVSEAWSRLSAAERHAQELRFGTTGQVRKSVRAVARELDCTLVVAAAAIREGTTNLALRTLEVSLETLSGAPLARALLAYAEQDYEAARRAVADGALADRLEEPHLAPLISHKARRIRLLALTLLGRAPRRPSRSPPR